MKKDTGQMITPDMTPIELREVWGHADIKNTKNQILEIGTEIIEEFMVRLETEYQCVTGMQSILDERNQTIANQEAAQKILRDQMTILITKGKELELQNNDLRHDKIRLDQLIEYQARDIHALDSELTNG